MLCWRKEVENLHLKQEALSLTQGRILTSLYPIHGNDAGDAGPNVGHARKHNECVLDVSDARDQRVCKKDEHHGHEADAPADALQKHECIDLRRSEFLTTTHDE